MTKCRRTLSALLAGTILAAAALSGCGGKTEKAEETQSPQSTVQEKAKAPLEVTLFYNRGTGITFNPEDPLYKELEKRTNTKLKIVAPPIQQYTEVLNLNMSAGQIPDIIRFNGTLDMINYASQGALAGLDDLLKKNGPNILEQTPADLWKIMKTDGKIMGIPTFKTPEKYNTYIRQDWLDKLSLKVPKTLEEYTEVMRAFTKKDPDGNGKNDTYGFVSGDLTQVMLAPFFGAFGVTYDSWYWDSGTNQMLSYDVHPNMKKALQYLQGIYKEGLINPDWITLKTEQVNALIDSNRAGMYYGWWSAGDARANNIVKLVPEVKIVPIAPPTGESGKGYNRASPVLGAITYSITTKAKNPDRMMEFLDFFYTTEGVMLTTYQMEGTDWKWNSGQPTPKTVAELNKRIDDFWINPEYLKNPNRGMFSLFEPQWDLTLYAGRTEKDNYAQKYTKQFPVLQDASEGLNPEARVKYKAALQKIREEYFARIITGELSVDSFDKFVSEWKKAGGDEVDKALTDTYNKMK